MRKICQTFFFDSYVYMNTYAIGLYINLYKILLVNELITI